MVSHCPRDERLDSACSVYLVDILGSRNSTVWSSLFTQPHISFFFSKLPLFPRQVLHSPRNNSFLLLMAHLCCPSSSYLKSSPLSALSSSFQVRCSKRPLLPALSNSVNSSCLCGWHCPGWHCIVYWFVEHLPYVLGAFPVSTEGQAFVTFTVLTSNRSPINASRIDLQVRAGIMVAKWSVKTLWGGYFRDSVLSLAQSHGLEIAQDLATRLSPFHSDSLTFHFHFQPSVWHCSDWLTLRHPSNLLPGPQGLDKSILRNRPFIDILLLSLMASGQAEPLVAGTSSMGWEEKCPAAHIAHTQYCTLQVFFFYFIIFCWSILCFAMLY